MLVNLEMNMSKKLCIVIQPVSSVWYKDIDPDLLDDGQRTCCSQHEQSKKNQNPHSSMQCGSLMYVPKKNVTPCGASPIRYQLQYTVLKTFTLSCPYFLGLCINSHHPIQTDKTLLQTSVPGLHCDCKCVCNSDFLYRVDCHSVYRQL